MSRTPDPIAYARCPACGVLGPPQWISWGGESNTPQVPVTIGCAKCRQEYGVADPRLLHREQDAVVWHSLCRTAVPCPAVAELVRCTVQTVGSPQAGGCGALIAGPAAGGQPPPTLDEPPVAPEVPPPAPRPAQDRPWGW